MPQLGSVQANIRIICETNGYKYHCHIWVLYWEICLRPQKMYKSEIPLNIIINTIFITIIILSSIRIFKFAISTPNRKHPSIQRSCQTSFFSLFLLSLFWLTFYDLPANCQISLCQFVFLPSMNSIIQGISSSPSVLLIFYRPKGVPYHPLYTTNI